MATPLSDYPFALEPVFIADADHLARAVDSPASESGPLFRLMFPHLGVDFSEQQKDEIIRWHAEGIKDAIIGGQTCRPVVIRVGLREPVLGRCQQPWWVKRSDFGVSKRVQGEMGAQSTVKGTLLHMAPELISHEPGSAIQLVSEGTQAPSAMLIRIANSIQNLADPPELY
ncbi:hypothetical protein VTK56DRAFT_2475 [Thermocarpiscus australiensis]